MNCPRHLQAVQCADVPRLVDLVLIVRSCEVDAELIRAALSAQARRHPVRRCRHRRLYGRHCCLIGELTLPTTLSAPSFSWMCATRIAGQVRARFRRPC